MKMRVSPPFLAWLSALAYDKTVKRVLARHRSTLEIKTDEEASSLLKFLFDDVGDQSMYAGHRRSSFRGFAARRLARKIERAQDGDAFATSPLKEQ